MMRKYILTALAAALTATGATAQTFSYSPTYTVQEKKVTKPFSSLEAAVTAGTTGVGIDVATPLSRSVRLRTGFEITPHLDKTMNFDIQSFGADGTTIDETKFEKMATFLEGFTGYHADSQVDMIGKPTMWNFKLLVDVFPFRNKNWHITAGFHWGNRRVAEALNSIDDAPSLVAVNMYNRLHYIADQDINHMNMLPLFEYGTMVMYLDPQIEQKLLDIGVMGIPLGTYKHDITDDEGNIIHHEGDRYRMTPDANSQVSARVRVNSFRPYLGFGYEGRLRRSDPTVRIGFDAGMMFWGGTPDVSTHDGTSLTKDVEGIGGKVGRYAAIIESLKVYPVLNVRISKTIF